MLYAKNTHYYKGKIISHFENEYGNEIKMISMEDAIRIVFTDGDSILLKPDWRGRDCYISQWEVKKNARS